MVELKSFFGRLGVVRERKREIKNVFKDLSNWVEKMFGEKSKIVEDQDLILEMKVSLSCLLDM